MFSPPHKRKVEDPTHGKQASFAEIWHAHTTATYPFLESIVDTFTWEYVSGLLVSLLVWICRERSWKKQVRRVKQQTEELR